MAPKKGTYSVRNQRIMRGAALLTRAAGRVAGRALARRFQQWKRKPNKPRINMNIRPVGTGASMSFFRRRYRARLPVKILKSLAPLRVLVNTDAGTIRTTAWGKQTCAATHQFECDSIASIFSLLVDGSGATTQSVVLRSIEQEYMISNADSANVFVKIYECTARNDFYSTSTSSGMWSGTQIWNAQAAYDHGLYEINNLMDASTLGVTPFQSQLFTQMWKVDKVYHVELGAGRSHKHQSTFSPNAMVHEPRTSRNKIIKGVTRAVLIVAYGSPINDTTTNTLVSTSKVALNIVKKQVAKIQFIDPQNAVYYNTQALGAIAASEHVDEDGDVQNETAT